VADKQPHYHLVITSEPGIAVPAIIRLRRLLKSMKRCWGFIWVEAHESQEQGDAAPPGEAGQDLAAQHNR
jgi:hypothetical protein